MHCLYLSLSISLSHTHITFDYPLKLKESWRFWLITLHCSQLFDNELYTFCELVYVCVYVCTLIVNSKEFIHLSIATSLSTTSFHDAWNYKRKDTLTINKWWKKFTISILRSITCTENCCLCVVCVAFEWFCVWTCTMHGGKKKPVIIRFEETIRILSLSSSILAIRSAICIHPN